MSSSAAAGGVAVGIVDSITGVAIGITNAHHEAHEGDSFVACFVDETMSDAETIILAFKTPAGTKRVHMLLQFETLVGGSLKLWEGATWDAQTGTQAVITNRKRVTVPGSSGVLANQAQAGFVAAGVVNANPTNFSVGAATLVKDAYAWGQRNQILAGGARDTEEVLLKPETQYAAVFAAIGNSNKAHVILNWYEHTDL